MSKFNTNYLILEAPDLGGKTSLYNEIHDQTGYVWNIQDRSALSMLCYAVLYGRNTDIYRQKLKIELNNLNNRFVLLLPEFKILKERYVHRGDKIQNLKSLRTLYEIFKKETKKIQHLPNILVLDGTLSIKNSAKNVVSWLKNIEELDTNLVGDFVNKFLQSSSLNEEILNVTIDTNRNKNIDSSILSNTAEGAYYTKIFNKITSKIQDEYSGLNSYKKSQTKESRRFIYSSDTCISSIHFLPRDNILNVMIVFRSTDVERNAGIDMKFLEFLATKTNKLFKWDCEKIVLNFTLNSAHIRADLRGIN